MKDSYKKYLPFEPIDIKNRQWPNNTIKHAPIWCSVDLRDGNQALVDPMNIDEKLEFFSMLCKIGIKEIEIGFPSASETEYEMCRKLIEENYIPDDVTIQVLVQAREHLIRKTFDAIKGAKNVILHFYNSTSTLQRKVVFNADFDGITKIATDAAKLVKELSKEIEDETNITFEYSPESFSGTELDFAVDICSKVMCELGATPEKPVIINLPNTVELATSNIFADQVEYFISHLKNRDSAIISIHPHNDRGSGIAAAELSLLAGAERVEGTLFGNGERTGNLDIVTLGLNLFTQGIDPKLDFSDLPYIKEVYERTTNMRINERHPYIGELVFTAFSGSHQDAINKGTKYMQENDCDYWEIPYLPIDPADIGRSYEPIIRINSQSGKGGAAYVMKHSFGYDLPKKMHPEFGALVQKECESLGRELVAKELFDLFDVNYPNRLRKYEIVGHPHIIENTETDKITVEFNFRCFKKDDSYTDHILKGIGNGPIDAFFNAVQDVIGMNKYQFVSYSQHAISSGSDSKAVSYSELLRKSDNKSIFGVGVSSNIYRSSIFSVLNAINRAEDLE